jgi:hypothetical protein
MPPGQRPWQPAAVRRCTEACCQMTLRRHLRTSQRVRAMSAAPISGLRTGPLYLLAQSISAMRFTPGAFGFLILIQSRESGPTCRAGRGVCRRYLRGPWRKPGETSPPAQPYARSARCYCRSWAGAAPARCGALAIATSEAPPKADVRLRFCWCSDGPRPDVPHHGPQDPIRSGAVPVRPVRSHACRRGVARAAPSRLPGTHTVRAAYPCGLFRRRRTSGCPRR